MFETLSLNKKKAIENDWYNNEKAKAKQRREDKQSKRKKVVYMILATTLLTVVIVYGAKIRREDIKKCMTNGMSQYVCERDY